MEENPDYIRVKQQKTKTPKNWTYIFYASEISISSKEKEKMGKRI